MAQGLLLQSFGVHFTARNSRRGSVRRRHWNGSLSPLMSQALEKKMEILCLSIPHALAKPIAFNEAGQSLVPSEQFVHLPARGARLLEIESYPPRLSKGFVQELYDHPIACSN